MLVKSFGCSFIFGTDLPDQTGEKPSQLVWPAVFSQRLGHHHLSYAHGGIGNLAIADRVLREISYDVTALFVIGWTWIDRFDYGDVNEESCWNTIRPGANSDLAKIYYRDLHSETRDKLTSLMTMRTVIDSLQERDFPFIMTYMDELLFDRTYNTTPTITALQNYIKPYMTTFEGKTFLEWSRSRGYPESASWHPLEQAHSEGAKIMRQAFDKQNTNAR